MQFDNAKGLHIFENEYWAYRYLFQTYLTGHIADGPCSVQVLDDVLGMKVITFYPSQWITLDVPEALLVDLV